MPMPISLRGRVTRPVVLRLVIEHHDGASYPPKTDAAPRPDKTSRTTGRSVSDQEIAITAAALLLPRPTKPGSSNTNSAMNAPDEQSAKPRQGTDRYSASPAGKHTQHRPVKPCHARPTVSACRILEPGTGPTQGCRPSCGGLIRVTRIGLPRSRTNRFDL